MSDFEVRALELMEKCQNSLYVIVAFIIFAVLALCGVLVIWFIYKDREIADKNKKQMKEEIIKEINNERK